jgi:hypothetical protein
MKRFIVLSTLISIVILFSCEKENEIQDSNEFQFEATVIGKGLDCGETFLISLKSLDDNTDIANGTYYADQLDSDLKIAGLKIYLNCRKPSDTELYACTAMGPSYPHVIVTDSKKNTNIKELQCNYIDFKYYNDEPSTLGEMSEDFILIGSDSTNSNNAIKDFVKTKEYLDHSYEFEILKDNNYPYKYYGLKLKNTSSCQEITWILNDLKESPIVAFAHYTMQTNNCVNLIGEAIGEQCVNSYSNIFYVKIKDANDTSDLNNTLLETDTWIREKNQFMDDWYSVFTDKNSKGDALEMANYFYETGLFAASEPDIIKIIVE